MFFRRLIRNKLAVLGAVLLIFLVAMAVLAPWVATHNPFKVEHQERLQPPARLISSAPMDMGVTFSPGRLRSCDRSAVGFLSIIVALTAGSS